MLTFSEIEQGIRNAPALPDPIDTRDFKLEDFAGAVSLPATFSLRDRQTPVKDQKKRGTCVSFAATSICEFFGDPKPNKTLDLSEEYLFKKIKEIDMADYGYDGYGSYLRSGAKALHQHGTCLETSLPYSPNQTEDYWKSVVITNQMNEEAAPYRLSAYASVRPTVEGIKTALVTTNSVVLCGFALHISYREAVDTGLVPIPAQNEVIVGNHGMEITGYTETHFEVKNSFGSFGDEGYIYWPFEAIQHMFSAWGFIGNDSTLLEQKLIEENKKQVPSWALDSWNAAIQKGIVTGQTKPQAILTKAEMFTFLQRLNII